MNAVLQNIPSNQSNSWYVARTFGVSDGRYVIDAHGWDVDDYDGTVNQRHLD